MSLQLIQINFYLNIPPNNYEAAANGFAERFATVPGLLWKIWLMNEDKREAGGIYMFRDEKAADDYLSSDFFKAMEQSPKFSKMNIKKFDILEEPGSRTSAARIAWSAVQDN
jgi:hypothetical protein